MLPIQMFRRLRSRRSSSITPAAQRRLNPILEKLESRIFLHSNPVIDAEHMAVMDLFPDSAVTYKSVATGKWSSPATWAHLASNGSVIADNSIPGLGANVLIAAGTTVTVDGDESKNALGSRVALHTVRDDGTLRFDTNVNTTLLVDSMLVSDGGHFFMGGDPNDPAGAGRPIQVGVKAQVIFADGTDALDSTGAVINNRDINIMWDPKQFSRGLIDHGTFRVAGTNVASFVKVDTALLTKATTINLGALPAGWAVGDRLIITGSTATNSSNQNQDEQVGITAINGATITLSGPLKYYHPAGSVYVSDVSRNAVFSSESVAIGDNTVAHRGHVMFMHNPDVIVNGAGFYGLGRTDKRTTIDDPVVVPDPDHPGQMTTDVIGLNVNSIDGTHRVYVPMVDAAGNQVLNPDGTPVPQIAKTGLNPRGRYAVHFHRTGSAMGDPAAVINDSAVVDSPGWGIVNHSSNVNVTNNTVFNAVGAAYITEAGDELGSFDHNIAIHSRGSGDGIESRKQFQDFGHEGDGFWLQGGNVSLTNNVVSGQRHSGYIFFPVGLDQKGLGVTMIDASTLADPTWAKGQMMVAVGDVPLRVFQNNIAFGVGDGLETWFSLLNVRDSRRTVIENFSAWSTNGSGVFTPYTNQITFKNVQLMNNLNHPWGTGFGRNDVTRSAEYDDVIVQGFETGINVPVNGNNVIQGGTFNDFKGIVIQTSNDRGRTVDFFDSAADPMVFQTLSPTVLNSRSQYDVFLQYQIIAMDQDITKLFNPDIVRMGTIRHNGMQLYYLEQASTRIPFPVGQTPPYVPAAFVGLTNQQLFDQFGLALGGIVAPPDAAVIDPRINALIGSPSTYLPDLRVNSARYYNPTVTPYTLSYKYSNPADPTASREGWVYVREATPTVLTPGWNVLTRTILGHVRSMLVYSDAIPPTFQFAAGVPTTVNKADIDNGANFVIAGVVLDDSIGSKNFNMNVRLNDPKFVSPIQTALDGSQFVILSFAIKDFAGNTTLVTRTLTVTFIAPLQKDLGRRNLPTMDPSVTLLELLGVKTLNLTSTPSLL